MNGAGRNSKEVRMALDVERIKKRQGETQAGSGERLKFVKGVNRIRVFKFTHKVTKEDVAAGHWDRDKLGKTVEEVDRPVTVHHGVHAQNRPVLSNQTIMARWQKLQASSSEQDQKQAESIKPQLKYAVNVVNTSEKPSKMRYPMFPKKLYNAVLGFLMNKDYGEEILGHKGRDVVIDYNPDLNGSEKYVSISIRDKDKCQVLPSKLDREVADFYSPSGFAKLGLAQAVGPDAVELMGAEEEAEEEEKEEAEEEAEEEEKEEAEEEEDDEEAEEEDDEEAEEEEDDEEAEEKPKKTRKK
jgi:hypothetical protein